MSNDDDRDQGGMALTITLAVILGVIMGFFLAVVVL